MNRERAVQFAYFLLRVVAGFLFLQAGGLILFGWYGGMPDQPSPPPFLSQTWIGGVLEFFGGIAIPASTGLEEAPAGATSFSRGAGDSEMGIGRRRSFTATYTVSASVTLTRRPLSCTRSASTITFTVTEVRPIRSVRV